MHPFIDERELQALKALSSVTPRTTDLLEFDRDDVVANTTVPVLSAHLRDVSSGGWIGEQATPSYKPSFSDVRSLSGRYRALHVALREYPTAVVGIGAAGYMVQTALAQIDMNLSPFIAPDVQPPSYWTPQSYPISGTPMWPTRPALPGPSSPTLWPTRSNPQTHTEVHWSTVYESKSGNPLKTRVGSSGRGSVKPVAEWFKRNRAQYAGKWVALDQDGRLIDADASRAALRRRLLAAGRLRGAVLTQVPEASS